MSDNNSLAQQALDTYDQEGEMDMLSFVRFRIDTRPAGQEQNESSLTVLADHTAIIVTRDRYLFLWSPTDADRHRPFIHTRPRNLQDRSMPVPHELRPIAIIGAVTTQQILHEALKRLETDIRLELGHSEFGPWLGQDPPITQDTTAALAPSLMAAVNTHAQTGYETDELYQAMDDLARETAAHALAQTDSEEKQALQNALRATIPKLEKHQTA